jgi:hypothetical protein
MALAQSRLRALARLFLSALKLHRAARWRRLLLCFGKKFAEKVLQEKKGCVQIRRRTWMCVCQSSVADQVTKVLRIADTHHAH